MSGTDQPIIGSIDHMGPTSECPRCGYGDFLLEEMEGVTIFRCLGCRSGWRFVLGYFVAVPDAGNVADLATK